MCLVLRQKTENKIEFERLVRLENHFSKKGENTKIFFRRSHHHGQPGLGKPGQVVEEDVELLAGQVQGDQLVRVGDVLSRLQLPSAGTRNAVLTRLTKIFLIFLNLCLL